MGKRGVRHWFASRSLRTKLLLLIMVGSVVAILVVSFAYAIIDERQNRGALGNELRTLADVLGANSVAAILFQDPDSARTTLASLAAKPSIIAARILLPGGEPFATYSRTPVHPEWPAGLRPSVPKFSENVVRYQSEIVFDGQSLGRIQLVGKIDVLERQRRALILVGTGVALFAMVVAFALSGVLARSIAEPIERLAGAMRDVSDTRDFSIRVQPGAKDEAGQLIRGFNDMLTRIQRQHEELTNYREHLESLVAKRTTELTDSNAQLRDSVEKLQRARDAAEAANEAKSQFLANMSHEIRTPLNAVLGFADVLHNEMFGPLGNDKYRDYVTNIRDGGKHLLAVISDVLDIARMDTGNFSVRKEESRLSDIIDGVQRMIESDAERSGILLNMRNETKPGLLVYCDPVRLRQVLLNLLSNAIKFTPAGGTVSCQASLDGDGLEIVIADDGVGMNEAELSRALEPFGQVETAYSRKHHGVGLGLPLSKTLIKLHGGTIHIESAPNVGTTIQIRLPPEFIVWKEAI